MKAIFILCALVAAAVACPCPKENDCSCSDSLPPICPATYHVKTFDSQCATIAFQGVWYVQWATPTFIKGQNPLKVGLFSNMYPCSNPRVVFQDTTPDCPFDYNTDYIMTDSSFNIATQCMETTQTYFKSAYGKDSPYAMFNVGTTKYYDAAIPELHPLVDESMFRHTIQDGCDREFTVAVIGCDDKWSEYMVFVILNQYDNFYSGNDDHIIWLLTRDSQPDYSTLEKAMKDIRDSGLNPSYLMSMDHSIDLSTIPSLTPDDISGISKTITTSSTTRSMTTSSSDSEGNFSTSSSTTTETKSTVEFTLNPDYTPCYEYSVYDLCGDNIKIAKNIPADAIREAISGQYFINSCTPCLYDDVPENIARVGLFNTGVPASSLQCFFDDSNKGPWDYTTNYMMMDRAYNAATGKVEVTRSIIHSSFDGSVPYGVFTVCTEGYYKEVIEDLSPITYDGINWEKPGDLYSKSSKESTDRRQYVACIVGYKPNKFMLFYVINKYKNSYYPDQQINQLYVMTRDRILSPEDIQDITQEVLLSGYDIRYLSNVDQTYEITEQFTFESSYFQIETTTSITTTSTTTSSSSTRSLPCDGSPDIPLPSICPPNYHVKTFDSQQATIAFQGPWYVKWATPTCIDGQYPLRTGLFSNMYPCSNNRVCFEDTTPGCPFDYNTDYIMTDSSFNMATQCMETTKTYFKSAYGSNSPYALFNIGTKKYYPSAIKDLHPLMDDALFRHEINDQCDREFTVAIIGCDEEWKEYMVFVVINQYQNFYGGNDDHIIWLLTRDSQPDYSTLEKAMKDIRDSGLNPSYLMSMDHSIDLSTIPSLTPDEISGVSKTVTTTSTTKSMTTTSSDSDGNFSSSSSTTTETKSTVEFTLNPDYTPCYEYSVYDLCGDNIKIAKNIPADAIREAISGQYFINSCTPCLYDDVPENMARVGLFNTGVPASSLQCFFDDSNKGPWDYKSNYMMMDRAYNAATGKVEVTRSIIHSSFDGSVPYGVFTVCTEGYYKEVIEDISPITYDGINWEKPGDLYRRQYVACIAGYKPNKFMLFYVINKYKNSFYQKEQVNQLYVMTRDRILSAEDILDLNQEILRCGYDARYLSNMDQTYEITEQFTFESSYFQIESSCSSSSVTVDSNSSSVDIDISGSSVQSSSSSYSMTSESSSMCSDGNTVEISC